MSMKERRYVNEGEHVFQRNIVFMTIKESYFGDGKRWRIEL